MVAGAFGTEIVYGACRGGVQCDQGCVVLTKRMVLQMRVAVRYAVFISVTAYCATVLGVVLIQCIVLQVHVEFFDFSLPPAAERSYLVRKFRYRDVL